jgi:hypothetical protein
MPEHKLSHIAMACFLEGIDPATLALAPGHLAHIEALIVGIRADSDTDGYYRCLESLSSESSEADA